MTINEIATIGMEFRNNYFEKYHQYVTITYKYGGVIRTRKELQMTKEGEAIMMGEALNAKVFTCPSCGKKVSFNDLEIWDGDSVTEIANNKVICSCCYEDTMGEDL